MLTSTVYTVASRDSCGLNAQIFITLSSAYTWVAENAEGPSDDTRAELLQLVDQSAFAAFWDLLTQRGIAATTKDAVSAYGRVGVSASPQA